MIRKHLEENRDAIKVEYLPKGSPDYNAVEECWKQGKDDLLVSRYYPKFPNLKSAISNYNRTRSFTKLLTGLTTGAVTGIIDRLEKARYIKRVNDPKDRRRTIIELIRNNNLERKLDDIFTPLSMRMHKVLSSYSDNAFLFNVLTKSLEQSHEELMKLRRVHK